MILAPRATAASALCGLLVAAAAPAPGDAALPPRLSGVVISSSVRVAIFADAETAAPLAAQEGDQIGSFTVRAIGLERVEVTGSRGTYVLVPSSNDGLRAQWAHVAPAAPLIDPDRREVETENDQ